MDRELIIQKFAALGTWKRAGTRAPHKPLLVLYAIGKLLRGENRLISYCEIDEYKCAICGFDVKLGNASIGLEASHIKWHAAGGPNQVVNGLTLCVLHHKLFDRGAFTLSEQWEVLVSDDAHGSVGFREWLMRFHGQKINFPQRRSYYPKADFICWHVREVFQGTYREL